MFFFCLSVSIFTERPLLDAISLTYQTRNSVIADKPRDAFVQIQGRG